MAEYESVLILRPDLDEEGITKTCDRISETITNSDGSVLSLEKVGMRRLAYEVEGFFDGFYLILNYNGRATVTSELERFFRISDEVIRYIIVKREVPFEKARPRRAKEAVDETKEAAEGADAGPSPEAPVEIAPLPAESERPIEAVPEGVPGGPGDGVTSDSTEAKPARKRTKKTASASEPGAEEPSVADAPAAEGAGPEADGER